MCQCQAWLGQHPQSWATSQSALQVQTSQALTADNPRAGVPWHSYMYSSDAQLAGKQTAATQVQARVAQPACKCSQCSAFPGRHQSSTCKPEGQQDYHVPTHPAALLGTRRGSVSCGIWLDGLGLPWWGKVGRARPRGNSCIRPGKLTPPGTGGNYGTGTLDVPAHPKGETRTFQPVPQTSPGQMARVAMRELAGRSGCQRQQSSHCGARLSQSLVTSPPRWKPWTSATKRPYA